MSFKEKYSSTTGKPITEEGFLQEPLGREFFDYAKNVIRSFINHVELKWYPGRTGMSLDDFVLDTASYAIEITREDYQKGKLRQENENSFKNFYWFRIKKAFFAKLDELGRDSKIAVFDERLGKYYEGTAVDFGLADEYDDFSLAEIVAENCEQDADDTSINESKVKKKQVIHHTPKKDNDVTLYFFSEEKAKVLEENHRIKMEYVKKILEFVSRLKPEEQRLFKLKFQLDYSDSDYQMWETIKNKPHCKDPFSIMAHTKYGISEGYAKKQISLILSRLKEQLNESGYTRERFRRDTAVPGMLEFLIVKPQEPEIDINLDDLSEDDCFDILTELSF